MIDEECKKTKVNDIINNKLESMKDDFKEKVEEILDTTCEIMQNKANQFTRDVDIQCNKNIKLTTSNPNDTDSKSNLFPNVNPNDIPPPRQKENERNIPMQRDTYQVLPNNHQAYHMNEADNNYHQTYHVECNGQQES